jgi:hypothetical protein
MLGDLLDFAGGLIGQRQQNKQYKQSLAFEREKFGLARDQFNQQMDASVQRRVKDAQAAGIHPLFALGASVGSSPTMTAGSAPAPTGSALGDAVSRIGARVAAAEIKKNEAEAKQSEAEAALADSKTATIAQRLASTGRDNLGTSSVSPTAETPNYYIPEVPTIDSTGVETGRAPAYKKLKTADGRELTIFSESAQADEINQAWLVQQVAKHKMTDAIQWLADRGIGVRYTGPGSQYRKDRESTATRQRNRQRSGWQKNVNPWR